MRDPSKVWRVNRKPRFPVLEMGEYMATDDGQRETILRNLKYERIAPTILYSDLQQSVAGFLASPTRDRGILAQCRERLEEAEKRATTPQGRDNAIYARRALDTFERSLNALPVGGLKLERAPLYPPHALQGVKISIQPTALITITRPRGATLRGAIIVDVAKGIEPRSDDLRKRATNAMTYTAMLLHEYVGNAIVSDGQKPSAEHCMVFHTHRQELVVSPAHYKKEMRIMEAACRSAARAWDGITPPPSFDARLARYRD